MSQNFHSPNLKPDLLATLAQLPNDEVFTPPHLADEMLDLLPGDVWSNHTLRWLDPATKSGVYLRQIANRLMVGLAAWEPNPLKRREHILRNMLFGAATTSLAGEISRRTMYHTSDATGRSLRDQAIKPFLVKFSSKDGNIKFVQTDHKISNGKCAVCRAPETLIRERRESFAYSFIHGTFPTEEMLEMKFDVIIGNPPYQIGMDDGQGNRTANITPLYHMFVERAIEMNPRYVLMITPSRWFSGGHSLSEYRDRMINDRRLRKIVDYANGREIFPGVEVKGGISYFLWDREYSGNCAFVQVADGQKISETSRDLREGQGVVIRDNFAADIVKKITSTQFELGSLAERVSTQDPFGQILKTNYKNSEREPFPGSIPLIYVNRIGHVSPEVIERNSDWIDKYKVLLPKASDGRGGNENMSVLGEPIAIAPGSACTQSYLVAGTFDSAKETKNYALYLTTKFVRFLVLQRKVSQDLVPGRFKFVPMLDMSKAWSDKELFELYQLDAREVSYIEKTISDRDWIDSLKSPMPETHLPGGRKFKSGDAPIEEEGDDVE